MTDAAIAAFGCVVTFIAVGGAFIFVQSKYEQGPERVREPVRVEPPRGPATRRPAESRP
ncbi:MAG: hypothetical protein QNK05_16840 [Myxococcota bacterium]|nr:hypothetical protein [Myxococcota bacterium]